MPRIFISYSRADRPITDELATRLRRIYGLDCVWFDSGLHGGDIWWQEILKQIAHCVIFIYLLSRDSIESDYCLAEWTEARRLRKLVLPVLVRAKTPIPPDLSVIQHIDMSSGITVDNITDLEAAINSISTNVPPMPPRPLAAEPVPVPPEHTVKPKRQTRTLFQKLIIGLGAGVTLLAVAALAIYFDRVTTPAQEPTSTVDSVALVSTETLTPLSPTATAIVRPTRAPTRAPTARPTATVWRNVVPTHTASTEEGGFDLAWRGVEHNDEWTPHTQTFDGVEMVLVPAGCFRMGSTPHEIEEIPEIELIDRTLFEPEQPASQICLDEPYWIDRYEVTNEQFERLRGAAVFRDRPSGAEQPMVSVSWMEALHFCEQRGARLPTEAEWEYAARGPDSLVYPWGNAVQYSSAVWEVSASANVGSRPLGVSWTGAYDLSGNVWEFASTAFDSDEFTGEFPYPYHADDGREDIERRTVLRVIRGGSWRHAHPLGRAAFRLSIPDYAAFDDLGFRCARDV